MSVFINEMIKQAYEYLAGGYFEDAVEAFSKCVLLEPIKPPEAKVYSGRGRAYFQLKKWKFAIADFEKAKKLDTEDPENWLGLALSLAMDNKIYEAIDVYETLLTANSQLVRAHIQLALLYYRLGVIGKGHRQLDIALVSRPSLAERRMIEELKKEQLVLDKKRYYKPDFEALREQNRAGSFGFLKGIKKLFSNKNH